MQNNKYSGLFFNNGKFSGVNDLLAIEESLSISVNDVPFTITMRTPGNEEELVRGLLFSEEIYCDLNIDPVFEVVAKNEKGIITSVNVKIPEDKILKEFAGSRNIMSVSSCGLCGKTSFEDTSGSHHLQHQHILDPVIVASMFDRMNQQQAEFQQTGGTHASGAFTESGEMLEIYEDIGRHNAVDKIIGGLIRNKNLEKAIVVTVSGRISYEIVNKVLSAGIPFLASVSAPSSMAVDIARDSGMTLMAFCRNNKLTVYSNPEKILQSDSVQVMV